MSSDFPEEIMEMARKMAVAAKEGGASQLVAEVFMKNRVMLRIRWEERGFVEVSSTETRYLNQRTII